MDDKNTPASTASNADGNPEADAVITETGAMQDAPDAAPTDQPSAPQSVMDVTPPPQDEAIAASEPMPDLAPEPPAAASDATPAAAPADSQSTVAPAVVTPTGADQAAPAPAPAKKSSKSMIAMIAVVLALVLASIAVLFYLRSKDDKTAATVKNTASTETAAAEPVTDSDVAATATDVDTAMSSLDENKDFSADTLSDKSLGLQ